MRLSNKVFRLVFVTFVTLILISNIVSFCIMKSIYTNTITNNLDNVMMQQKQNVDNRLIRLYELLCYPSYANDMNKRIKEIDTDTLSQEEKDNLKREFNDFYLLNTYIPLRTYFLTSSYKLIIDKTHSISQLFTSPSGDIISSAVFSETMNFTNQITIYRSPQKPDQLTFSRGVFYTNQQSSASREYIGTMLITIDYTDLTDQLRNFSETDGQDVFLVSPDYDIFGIHNNIPNELVNAAISEMNDYPFDYYRIKSANMSYYNNHYYVQVVELNTTWQILCILNYKEINKATMPLLLVIVLTTICMIALIFLLSHRFIPRAICSPISKLSETMQLINTSGNYDHKIDDKDKSCYEISALYQSFDMLLQHILKQIDEIKLENEKNQRAELKLLQKQINPHFLYNTLDSISFSIMDTHPKITSALSTLSDLLRYATYEPYKMVTLSTEIDNIKKYVKIQNFCYSMEIDVIVESDHADSCYLPKLTLQPLVENAIQHGIRESSDDESFIKISTVLDNDWLMITLENSGKSPDIEMMYQLTEQESPVGKLGLFNVNKRLIMQFGTQSHLNFAQRDGGGTIITIAIPF